MSITKTLLAGVAGTVLASGMATAGEPMKLSTTEMDQVTAGFFTARAEGFPSSLFGFTGAFSQDLYAGGNETTSINSTTNFSSRVAANAGGTSTGEGSGLLTQQGGIEGLFVFGGLQALSQVQTNVVF